MFSVCEENDITMIVLYYTYIHIQILSFIIYVFIQVMLGVAPEASMIASALTPLVLTALTALVPIWLAFMRG